MRATVPTMLHRIPITKARVRLGELAKRVYRNKEYFILEKDGIPIIGIMGAEELEDYLDIRDPKIQARIKESTGDYLAGRHRDARELSVELKPKRKSIRKTRRSTK